MVVPEALEQGPPLPFRAQPSRIERASRTPGMRPRLGHHGRGTSLSTSISMTARPLPGLRPTVMRAMLTARSPEQRADVADDARRVLVLHEQQVALRDRVHLDAVDVDEAQVVAPEERARHRELAPRSS